MTIRTALLDAMHNKRGSNDADTFLGTDAFLYAFFQGGVPQASILCVPKQQTLLRRRISLTWLADKNIKLASFSRLLGHPRIPASHVSFFQYLSLAL